VLLVHLSVAGRPRTENRNADGRTMIKLRALSRREALRIVFPLAIIMPTTIAWAGEVNSPANVKPIFSEKLRVMDARARQHSIRAR
jgi:hypothetical protein